MPVNPKKSLGQNFLNDLNIVKKIIKISDLSNDDQVVEIGPGKGVLTKELVKHCKDVVAYEIDQRLIPILNTEIQSDNFTIIHQDFLKADLNWNNKKVLIANIPYYITSDILFKIFLNAHLFKKVVLMMQKEVAMRLCAKPKTSNYGKLSVVAQYFTIPQIQFDVSPGSFFPPPKVTSSVIMLKMKPLVFDKEDQTKFLDFVKKCFAMQRKTLNNNLKKQNIVLKKEDFLKLELLETCRPQELSIEKYKELFNMIFSKR